MTYFRAVSMIVLVLLLAACVRYFHSLRDVKELRENEPLVFGCIKAGEGGWVHIVPDGGPEPIPYIYPLSEDGSFYWQLPPGDYIITEYVHAGGFWTTKVVRRAILARFVIPEATSSIYIGTLTIGWWGGRYAMDVKDEYDHALQRLTQRFPNVKGPVTRSLMQLELP